MLEAETKVRVRYAETDQMGYVYYGNYATYLEVGRVEAMRKLGMSYRELEESGIMLPVMEYNIRYFKPALYDDELTIITYIKEIPKVKIRFDYEVFKQNELICAAHTTLVFVNKQNMKPVAAPKDFIEKLSVFF